MSRRESTWFVVDDPEEDGEEPWDFGTEERAFISALQDRAASWRTQSAYSVVCRPEDESFLLVCISLFDDERPLNPVSGPSTSTARTSRRAIRANRTAVAS